MAKSNTNLIVAVVVIGAAIWFLSGGNMPVTPGSVAQPSGGQQGGGLLTGNPGLTITVLDSKTQSVNNEAIVRLLDSTGQLRATATTVSGVATFTSLDPSTTYTAEILPTSGTTAFYAFSKPVSTNAAGSKTAVMTYVSQTTTAPTVTVYNNDNITSNSYTVPQAVGFGDSVTFRIRIRPASSTNDNNMFSSGIIKFAVDYNSLSVQSLTMKEGSTAMPGPNNVVTVNGHTTKDANQNATSFFDSIATSLAPATDYDYYLTVKAATAQQPVAVTGEIYVTAYDACRVQDTRVGTYGNYYQHPVDNSAICSGNAVTSVYMS